MSSNMRHNNKSDCYENETAKHGENHRMLDSFDALKICDDYGVYSGEQICDGKEFESAAGENLGVDSAFQKDG